MTGVADLGSKRFLELGRVFHSNFLTFVYRIDCQTTSALDRLGKINIITLRTSFLYIESFMTLLIAKIHCAVPLLFDDGTTHVT
jgi:hypothetical protein